MTRAADTRAQLPTEVAADEAVRLADMLETLGRIDRRNKGAGTARGRSGYQLAAGATNAPKRAENAI